MLAGIQQTSIGVCPHLGGWDATTAASGQSVLSGVLAGFVFGGIVVVLSTREGRHGRETARALKLLFSAFFGLVVTAYLFADQAADTDCLRAFAEENLAGALLGVFALVLIVSLTWLVVAYRLHAEGALAFFRSLIYFAAAFVVLLLCTSSYSYLQYVLPHKPPSFTFPAMYGIGVLGFAFAIPPGSWTAAARRVVGKRTAQLPRPSAVTARSKAVELCARSALGFLAVAAIADAVVLATPDDWWSRPRPVLHYANAWGSLALSLVILVLALRAIAPDNDADAQGSENTVGAGAGRSLVPAIPDTNPSGTTGKIVVDREMLLRRLEGYGVDHYTVLHNTVASVALAVAGLSAASLAGSRAIYGDSWALSWMMWLASFLLCAVIFAGAMSGSIAMPPLVPSIPDLVVPLLLGIGEFVLFAVLAHQVSGLKTASSIAVTWFVTLTVVCALAIVAISQAMRFFGRGAFTEDLVLVDRYRSKRLPSDRRGASITAAVGAAGAAASAAKIPLLEYVAAALVILGLLMALLRHAQSSALLQAAISGNTRSDLNH